MSEELKAAQARIAELEAGAESLRLTRDHHHDQEIEYRRRWAEVSAELAALKAQEPASTEFKQFMTSVVTAAGLLSCGKQSKSLAADISASAYKYLLAAPVVSAEQQGVADAGDIVLNANAQEILAQCIGAHAYVLGVLANGRPDLAFTEAKKWVDAFRDAAHRTTPAPSTTEGQGDE